jgi:hypothetical protein
MRVNKSVIFLNSFHFFKKKRCNRWFTQPTTFESQELKILADKYDATFKEVGLPLVDSRFKNNKIKYRQVPLMLEGKLNTSTIIKIRYFLYLKALEFKNLHLKKKEFEKTLKDLSVLNGLIYGDPHSYYKITTFEGGFTKQSLVFPHLEKRWGRFTLSETCSLSLQTRNYLLNDHYICIDVKSSIFSQIFHHIFKNRTILKEEGFDN